MTEDTAIILSAVLALLVLINFALGIMKILYLTHSPKLLRILPRRNIVFGGVYFYDDIREHTAKEIRRFYDSIYPKLPMLIRLNATLRPSSIIRAGYIGSLEYTNTSVGIFSSFLTILVTILLPLPILIGTVLSLRTISDRKTVKEIIKELNKDDMYS